MAWYSKSSVVTGIVARMLGHWCATMTALGIYELPVRTALKSYRLFLSASSSSEPEATVQTCRSTKHEVPMSGLAKRRKITQTSTRGMSTSGPRKALVVIMCTWWQVGRISMRPHQYQAGSRLTIGFHNQMIGQPVRWDFVFKWFEMLLAAPLIQSGTYYTQASWVVLPWHDPTQETLPTGQLRLPHQYDEQHFNNWVTYQEQHGFLFTSTSTSPCEPGHYVLVGEFRGMTVLGQASRNFVAQEPQFDSSTQCLRTRPLSVGFTYNRTSQASPQPVKQRKVGYLRIVHSITLAKSDY